MLHQQHLIGAQVDQLLLALWDKGGTDLLLTAGLPPMLRVDGVMTPVEGASVLTAQDTTVLLAEVLTPEQSEAWNTRHEFDFSFSWREHARIRGNAFTQRGLTAVALRMIPREIPTIEDLGLPPVLRDLSLRHQGLILMTGPTGSGKSTTLAAMIDLINTQPGLPHHHHRGPDRVRPRAQAAPRSTSARSAPTPPASPTRCARVLREDPDVLLVGEMRDLESIRFALTIAETGHLVFATLHTNDTAQSLARMIDVFPAEQQAQIRVQLAAALTGVVYQRLIPRIGGGMVAAYEVLVADTRGAQPDQGRQDPPAAQLAGDRPARRHGHPRAVAVRSWSRRAS